MKLSLFVIFFFLVGCVGTVQDTSAPKTVLKQESLPTITFAGVNKAYGIADDKIEVLFYPPRVVLVTLTMWSSLVISPFPT